MNLFVEAMSPPHLNPYELYHTKKLYPMPPQNNTPPKQQLHASDSTRCFIKTFYSTPRQKYIYLSTQLQLLDSLPLIHFHPTALPNPLRSFPLSWVQGR